MSDNETSADIIAEMETERPGLMNAQLNTNNSHYARRLKAALKRECGNAAKLREALRKINNLCGIGVVDISSFEIGSICDAALAEPPRNCDVGTASEQEDRFAKYCRGSNYCAVCPIRKSWDFKNGRRPSCAILWVQMPYEEGGVK